MSLGKKETTHRANHRAIIRAAHYLEQRLDEPVQISELARHAGMSMFHFQRAFREVVGETVKQHHLRLRLERSAYYLKFSNWQLQEVSLAAGFTSQASFSRAFQKFYQQSPSAFRNDQSVVPFLRSFMREKKGIKENAETLNDIPAPTVRIKDWPDQEVVALRYYGPVSGLTKPWNSLLKWIKQQPGIDLIQCRFFGLWFDDWSDQPNPSYRYECAVLLPNSLNEAPLDPFFIRKIDAGSTAVASIHGNIGALDRAWKQMIYGWLPFSGYQPRLEYVLDEYPVQLMLSPPWMQIVRGLMPLTIQICVPIMTGKAQV